MGELRVNDKRTQRVRFLILVASAAIVAVLTGALLSTGDKGVRVATVLALPVMLIAVYLSAVGWVRGRSPDESELRAASSEILHDLGEATVDAQQRVLAPGMDVPIEISYARWPTRRSKRAVGKISTIYDFYSKQPAHRIVILGEGGSGKTVLTLDLTLQMMRAQHEASPNDSGTIPLRLSLSSFLGWDQLEANREPDYIAKKIETWIISEFQTATNQPKYIARALIRSGLVLPILDGLDEMDRDDTTPENAMALLRGLNYPTVTGLRSVIIVCRTKRFEQLVDHSGNHEVVADAAVIQMLPIDVARIVPYLQVQARRLRLPGRWRQITTILRDSPQSPLAQSVTSPLDLYLLMNALDRPVAELVSFDQEDLRRALLGNLVPACVARGVPHDAYTSAAVSRWLKTLARGLANQAVRGESETDIDITRIWTFGGMRLPRAASAFATLLIGFAILMVPYGWARYNRHHWLPLNNKQWFIDSLGLAVVLIATFRASMPQHKVLRMDFSALGRESGRRRIRHYVGVFFIVGFVFGCFFFELFGWAFAVSFCFAVAIAFGALYGLVRAPAIIASPRKFIRDSMLADLFFMSEVAVIYGFTNGFANGLAHHAYGGLIFGLAYGWLLSMAIRATSPWLRYFLVILGLSRRKKLPGRLAEFLEWGTQTGLLRQSGTRIQFRHSVIREFLI